MSATVFDVYDPDESLWACWHIDHGYLCDWMPERDYMKWYYVHYGCLGRKLPSSRTLYRTEADEREKRRAQIRAGRGV